MTTISAVRRRLAPALESGPAVYESPYLPSAPITRLKFDNGRKLSAANLHIEDLLAQRSEIGDEGGNQPRRTSYE